MISGEDRELLNITFNKYMSAGYTPQESFDDAVNSFNTLKAEDFNHINEGFVGIYKGKVVRITARDIREAEEKFEEYVRKNAHGDPFISARFVKRFKKLTLI